MGFRKVLTPKENYIGYNIRYIIFYREISILSSTSQQGLNGSLEAWPQYTISFFTFFKDKNFMGSV